MPCAATALALGFRCSEPCWRRRLPAAAAGLSCLLLPPAAAAGLSCLLLPPAAAAGLSCLLLPPAAAVGTSCSKGR